MHRTPTGRWEPDRPPRETPLTKTQQKIRHAEARLAHSFDFYNVHTWLHTMKQEGCCFCDPSTCQFKDLHADSPHPWDIIRGVNLGA